MLLRMSLRLSMLFTANTIVNLHQMSPVCKLPLCAQKRGEVYRGEIWWAELPEPIGSEPGFRRPVLIVQADTFNASRIRTVVAVTLTTNLVLAEAPGNVLLPEGSGLPHASVVNVSQVITLDKAFLRERVGVLADALQVEVDGATVSPRLVKSLQF